MEKKKNYVLGLDIGSSSIGWALIEGEKKLVASGVRIFDPGMEGEIEQGKEESRNKKRREMRQQRRQTDRRRRRRNKIYRILYTRGLLPGKKTMPPKERHETIKALDKELVQKHCTGKGKEERHYQLLPYILRVRALDKKLEPYELGRAFYHLSQHRGFLSNKKSQKKEEEGVVKKGISELETLIQDSKSRTLGEFFSTLDPEIARIRERYTHRSMYEHEFNKIWEAQKKYYPKELSDKFYKDLHKAIFHQRPLKSVKRFVGNCEYEPTSKRAPWASLEAQRFRIFQVVNNISAVTVDGEVLTPTPEQRKVLVDALDKQKRMSLSKVKSLLGFPKDAQTNYEKGGEKEIKGNSTSSTLREIFGDRWDSFTEKEENQIIEDILSIQKEEVLEKRGKRVWKLDDEKAKDFAEIELETSYCHLSRKAIKKLMPYLEGGMSYMTAVQKVYQSSADEPEELLPPVLSIKKDIRNPVVFRVLTEVRKVVNGVIRKYGKPGFIRIELARDTKKSKAERSALWKKNLSQRKVREEVAARIIKQTGIKTPTRRDIEKVLLLDECKGICPYTGKSISMKSLFGDNPQFDIEHIIPFSRSLDNSFANKTLCDIEENRRVKKNCTPFEAYSGDPKRYQQMLLRVQKFNGDFAREKLRRFKLDTLENFEDFINRQLNDTRYSTRLACDYLGRLYGGVIDEGGTRRIQAARGGLTAYLRGGWKPQRHIGRRRRKETR